MQIHKIATFNIRHGRGLDDAVDLKRTATAIADTGADLIALQELDRGFERSGGIDQPAALQELSGLVVTFWPTVRRAGREYGFAVACEVALAGEWHDLPRRAEEEPRGAVAVRWRGLHVVATHLSTDRGARRLQTDELLRVASDLPAPVVVVGDLNQGRWGLRGFRRSGFDLGRKTEHTHTPSALRAQIDFVLAGPGCRLAATTTVTSDASDHVPLLAEVAVPDPPFE
ncbi:MAG: endonuclease/exonuclease/phosphatase family protein [Actinomycetota bacterium]|nr:endonuclease/exonuclease/phosphatase family protein [Actinomycetota bacterium]